MEKVVIRDEFIRLGQAMKLAGMVENGAQAKAVIQGGEVLVNGQTETQRGKKLRAGDEFTYRGESAVISS